MADTTPLTRSRQSSKESSSGSGSHSHKRQSTPNNTQAAVPARYLSRLPYRSAAERESISIPATPAAPSQLDRRFSDSATPSRSSMQSNSLDAALSQPQRVDKPNNMMLGESAQQASNETTTANNEDASTVEANGVAESTRVEYVASDQHQDESPVDEGGDNISGTVGAITPTGRRSKQANTHAKIPNYQLPALNNIRTPFILSPPKQAIVRRDEIIKKTGSPPELHHAQIRQAVQRLSQTATLSQRNVVRRIHFLAKDTRFSFKEMAKEISRSIHSAIGSLKHSIEAAKVEIGNVVTAIETHFEQNRSLIEEELKTSQSSNSENVRMMLLEGSDDLRVAEENIVLTFLPYLDDAKAKMKKIGTDGIVEKVDAPHVSTPEGTSVQSSMASASDTGALMSVDATMSLMPEESSYKNMDDIQFDIEDKCQQLFLNGGLGLYQAVRAHPVANHHWDQTQAQFETTFERQAEGLEIYRNNFIFSALGLITPTMQSVGNDERGQIEQTNTFHRGATDDIELATQYDIEFILAKQQGVEQYLDDDLGKKLINSFYEMEEKAVGSFLHQGEMGARMLENTSVPMSQAYPDIIARVESLLPADKFLEAEKYLPSILSAEKSAIEIPDLQMAQLEKQAEDILNNADVGKQKQIQSIAKSLNKGLQSINDVVVKTSFDMDNFTYQSTGVMRIGGEDSIRNAQDFALGTAEQLLKTKGEANGHLNQLIAGYVNNLNTNLRLAGDNYYQSVESFHGRLFDVDSGVFTKIAQENVDELSPKVQALNAALTHVDTNTAVGLALISPVVAIGYVVVKDSDESAVFTALGGLQWPGQPALEDLFEHGGEGTGTGNGDLRERIKHSLDSDDAIDALDLLSPSAAVRGNARLNAAERSLSYTDFGISDEAREQLLAGMSDTERTTLDEGRIEHLANEINGNWGLNDIEEKIQLGYLRGNLDEVVAARMEEQTSRARNNGDANIQQAVQNIDTIARKEMRRGQSADAINGSDVQALIDDSMQEFAANRPGEARDADAINISEARQRFADFATADRVIHYPGTGDGPPPPPQIIPIDQFVKDYVDEVINNGFYTPTELQSDAEDAVEPNPNARAAAQAYQIHRGNGNANKSHVNDFNAAFANPSYQRLQVEIQEIRDRGETVSPEKLQQLAQLHEQHGQQMARVAARLGKPGLEPGAATQWVAQRAAQAMSGNDAVPVGETLYRSDAEPGMARFATEVVRHGRASIVAGVHVAGDGAGTNEVLLRSIYGNRKQSEIAAAEDEWENRYDQDLNEYLGIKEREWDALDYAAFSMAPILGPGPALGLMMFRGGETSGDLAMDLEILAQGEPENDIDRLRIANMRAEQQQGRGTSFLAQYTMADTTENTDMHSRRQGLAKLYLTVARANAPSGTELPLLDNVFTPKGDINSLMAPLVFDDDGQFRGNRGDMLGAIHGLKLSGDRYQAEQARQESIMLAGITVLAMVTTVVLMAFGVGFVLAGIITALGAGLLTMGVKQGMRGERYGWEEAANDTAMTAIQVAAAGAGGALSGGFGKAGKLGAVVGAFNKMGPIAGPMAREAIVGAVSGTAQMALQDSTFADGPGKALERLLGAGLKGGAIGAVSAGLSEGATQKLGGSLTRGLEGQNLGRMARVGASMGPNGRAMMTEVVSEGLGSVAGEGVGILIEVQQGQFRGGLDDALRRLGRKGLEDMVSAAGRTAATSRNKRIYGEVKARLIDADVITQSDLRVLRMAGAAAGEPFESLDAVRQRIDDSRRALSALPPELRDMVKGLDAENLNSIVHLLTKGAFVGGNAERQALLRSINEKAPQIDTIALTQQMQTINARRQNTLDAQTAITTRQQQEQTREQLLQGIDSELAESLKTIPIDGLEKVSLHDLQSIKSMIERGHLDQAHVDVIIARARAADPELDTLSVLLNVQQAVNITQHAKQLEREIKRQTYQHVMQNFDAEGQHIVSGLPAKDIVQIKQLFDSQTPLSARAQKALFDSAQKNNPDLTQMQFDRVLDFGIAHAARQQQKLRDVKREQRLSVMENIPESLRDVLSALPDDALIDLRFKQQDKTLTTADINHLKQRALVETPNVDITALEQALHKVMEYQPDIRSQHGESTLRRELTAAIPKEQRDKFSDVPIIIMHDGEFEAFTRSQKAQAVTLIIDGRAVVVMRQSADAFVLREEGIHVLQNRDPEWANRLGALDERTMADWDSLPLAEQLALYRNKIIIELDAQQRVLNSLKADMDNANSSQARTQLDMRLEQAQAALRNLTKRAGEVESIGGTQRKAIVAGKMDKPDWLEQPARLFAKLTDEQKKKNIIDDINRHKRGSGPMGLADLKSVDIDTLEKVMQHLTADSDPVRDVEQNTARALLYKLVNKPDKNNAVDNVEALATLVADSPPQQTRTLVEKLARVGSPDDVIRIVHVLAAVMDGLSITSHRKKVVGLLGDEGLINILRKYSHTDNNEVITADILRRILISAPDADAAKRFVNALINSSSPVEFSKHLHQVMKRLPSDTSAELLQTLSRKPNANIDSLLQHLSRLIDIVPDANSVELSQLFESLLSLRLTQTEALEKIADTVVATKEKIDTMQLTPNQKTALLAGVIGTMNHHSRKDYFAEQTLLFFGKMSGLEETPDGVVVINHLIDKLNGDMSTSGSSLLTSREVAYDIVGSATLLDNASSIPDVLKQFAEHIVADGLMSKRDAWLARVAEAHLKWPEFARKNADFVMVLDKAYPHLEANARVLLADVQPWFDQIVAHRALGDADRKIDPITYSTVDHRAAFLKTLLSDSLSSNQQINSSDALRTIMTEIRMDTVGYAKEPDFNQQTLAEMAGLGVNAADMNAVLLAQLPSHEVMGMRAEAEQVVAIKNGSEHWTPARRQAEIEIELLFILARLHEPKQSNLRLEADKRLKEVIHLEDLIRQRQHYEFIHDAMRESINDIASKEGWAVSELDNALSDIDADFSGSFGAKLTEVIGEIDAYAAIRNAPAFKGMELARGFEVGTGFDQAWFKRNAAGDIIEILIVEAKGPNAGLSQTKQKGFQMDAQWVGKTLQEMKASSDPNANMFAHVVLYALTHGAKISGVLAGSDIQSGHESVIGVDPATGSTIKTTAAGDYIFVSDSASGEYDVQVILDNFLGNS